ncbi:MAG: alpha/beta hydrolase [Gammaproteobacteria bacterium]|nr:alpha/beta hydrolase [Gammaproteobacteria bacterium]
MGEGFLPKWIEANGTQFAYLEAGEGPLVLCLHGFPDTAWSFRPLLSALAGAGFRAVAPFMRGYAPSAIPADGDYRPTVLARDVVALTDHFGARQACVVGHDWGAVAAYTAATLRPDRVTRVVAAAVPHPRRFLLRPTLAQLRRSRYMALFQLRGIAERRVAANRFAWLDGLIREWSPGWNCAEDDLAPIKADLADPARLRAALGYYRALPKDLFRPEAWQLLAHPLPVPARVIYGEDDGCIGAEMFHGMEHLFGAGLDLCPMEGVGHFMHCEHPAEFNRRVVEFLRV